MRGVGSAETSAVRPKVCDRVPVGGLVVVWKLGDAGVADPGAGGWARNRGAVRRGASGRGAGRRGTTSSAKAWVAPTDRRSPAPATEPRTMPGPAAPPARESHRAQWAQPAAASRSRPSHKIGGSGAGPVVCQLNSLSSCFRGADPVAPPVRWRRGQLALFFPIPCQPPWLTRITVTRFEIDVYGTRHSVSRTVDPVGRSRHGAWSWGRRKSTVGGPGPPQGRGGPVTPTAWHLPG